jgi:threonine dehydrogenase-like Zn-dependent dehydrogenase
VLERWLPCGRCPDCRQGAFQRCITRIGTEDLFYGGTPTHVAPHLWGGFAKHMYLHPDTVLHRITAATPADMYPLFLPLANAVSWVQLTGALRLGTSVLIEGPGPIGLMCTLVASALGARHVIVSGLAHDAKRLDLAKGLGATAVVATTGGDDVVELCRETTGGAGVDLVVDCTTSTSIAPFDVAVEAVRVGGTVLLATQHEGPATRSYEQIFAKTLTVSAVRSRQREAVGIALELLTDQAWVDRLRPLCHPTVSLTGVGTGFDSILDGSAVHASVLPHSSPAAH